MAEAPAPASEKADAKPPGVHIALVPPCRFLVKATAGARVVGKAGVSIKAIRAESGATVRVFQDELPEVMKRRDENIVLASCGEVSSLKVAMLSILDRIFDRSGIPDHAERNRERPFVVDVLVPERAAGPLVGPSGERVKALIAELACDIDVGWEPLAGIAAQRRVRVLSRERARVEAAVWRLQEILAELVEAGTLTPEHFELREEVVSDEAHSTPERREAGTNVPLRILLAPGEAAVVVGKLGYSIRRLRDIAHVSVDSVDTPAYSAESPPFALNETVCSVGRATLASRLRVLRLIIADLVASRASRRQEPLPEDSLPEGARPCSIRLLFPRDCWEGIAELLPCDSSECPCNLRIETGVDVRVQECAPPSSFRRLEIHGSEDQIAVAVWRLHQKLEPWEAFEVPPKGNSVGKGSDEQDEGKGSSKGGKIRPRLPKSSVIETESETRLLSTAYGANSTATQLRSSELSSQAEVVAQTSTSRKEASIDVAKVAPETLSPPLIVGPVTHGEKPASANFESPEMERTQHQLHQGTARTAEFPTDCERLNESNICYPMYVQVHSDLIAVFLAADDSSIAKLTGVKLKAWPRNLADGRPPTLEINGSVESCAMACYLIQAHQWLSSLTGPAC